MLLVAVVASTILFSKPLYDWSYQTVTGKRSLASAIADVGQGADDRLRPYFDDADVSYPPAEIALIGLKDERVLEMWARNTKNDPWTQVHTYKVLAASGDPGPKLMEGDRQVPEGLYATTFLNPNSQSYLSIRLGYPNEFDQAMGAADGRTDLGGDIMIHGKNIAAGRAASIGCLAVDDPDIEELFTLVHRVGLENTKVIVAPSDMRAHDAVTDMSASPEWTPELYETIQAALEPFKS